MKDMTITKTWELKSGGTVKVIGTLTLEKDVDLDGMKHTVNTCDISIDIVAKGQSQGSWIKALPEVYKGKIPAEFELICGKLPMTQAQKDIVDSVRAELQQHPAWIAEQATIAKNEADNADYDKVVAEIERQNGE